MIIKVRMIANGNGQNDVQPRPQFSVGVGDVIEFGNDLWMVTATGFKLITEGQFEVISSLSRRSRALFPYAFSNY